MDLLHLLGLQRDPDEMLVHTRDRTYTTAQLRGQAAALAGRLADSGEPGGRAIISTDSGPAFVAALAACLQSGTEPVLLDPQVRGELQRVIQLTGARALIGPAPTGKETGLGDIAILVPDLSESDPPPLPEDAAGVLYLFTSGSTGIPQLVPKRYEHLQVEVEFLAELLGGGKNAATMVPWCHIFGLIVSLLLPASTGGTCNVSAGISPRALLEQAAAAQVDLVVAVPAIFGALIRQLEADPGLAVSPDCIFVSSGAALPLETRQRFGELSGCSIIDLYGSTEAGGVAFRQGSGPWTAQPHVRTRIDSAGHLWVSSQSVSVVEPGKWYDTGDLVERAGSGFVLRGRADDLVKIGGRRVALREVEAALRQCPGVDDAAVVTQTIRGETRLAAYLETGKTALDSGRVKRFARTLLADHKVPARIHLIEALPRSPAGKVLRSQLQGTED